MYLGKPECSSYTILNNITRSVSRSRTYRCDNWMAPAWYRFVMPAGTRIPESSPGSYHCGTNAPGWLSGSHPTSTAETVDVKFCFDWSGNDCRWSTKGKITNCSGFFVYYLEKTPACSLRYCASN